MAKLISSIYSSTDKYVSAKAERRRLRGLRKRFKKHSNKGRKRFVHPVAGESKEAFATRMRENPTSLELILGSRLRRVVAGRYKILSQSVQWGYIFDFYLPELRLCFEADGPQHDRSYDSHRDGNVFRSGAIRTIRFTSGELYNEIAMVDRVIGLEIESRRRQLRRVCG